MTGHIRLTLIAAAIAVLVTPHAANLAFAAEKKPDVTGPTREYHEQPAPAPPRNGTTGLDGEPLGVDGEVVHRKGSLGVSGNISWRASPSAFDFDDGRVVEVGSVFFQQRDFSYVKGTWLGPNIFVSEFSARMWPGDGAPRGYAACHAARNTESTTAVAPTTGQHVCYVTGDGRVGELRFGAMQQATNGYFSLTVSYTTWR